MTHAWKAYRGAACAALLVVGGQGTALAGDAGAFIGGMVTAKVLNNMERRTQAEESQAYYASRPQPAPRQAAPAAPAAPAKLTTEQKLQQLDKLAAGGYITPEEYKSRRKAILDGM